MGFLVIPAVDIKEGKVVRLKQGLMDQVTVYGSDPVDMALHWVGQGAERLHIVDLDGAVEGRPKNLLTIEKIIARVGIPVEIGGGIRDRDTARAYLEAGASYVILGTMALESPHVVKELCKDYPGKVILGVDAKDGYVAVRGWTKTLAIKAIDLLKEYERDVAAVIYTDIKRDGMKVGANLEMARDLAQNTQLPLILAGGIKSLKDVMEAMTLYEHGVIGVITGRAIYDGTLDLKEAIGIAKGGSYVRGKDK